MENKTNLPGASRFCRGDSIPAENFGFSPINYQPECFALYSGIKAFLPKRDAANLSDSGAVKRNQVSRRACKFFILSFAWWFLPLPFIAWQARSQTFDGVQSPNPVDPTIPRQPPPLPPLEPLPSIPAPLETPPPSQREEAPKYGPDTIVIKAFAFEGNTAFSDEKLAEITKNFIGDPITFEELFKARDAVTKLYTDNGYATTGAYIPEQDVDVNGGIVTIQIVEGEVEEIRVRSDETGQTRLNPNYVRSRLKLATDKPLNQNRLIEALQLLRLNPLIDNIKAELLAGSTPGANILDVEITEAKSFSITPSIDNNRSPSAGSFRRGISFNQANLSGLGDNFNANFQNTDGSNEFALSYTLPFNPRNGTINLGFRTSGSHVIEEPFDPLDIEARSSNYELTLRQPLIQRANQKVVQEFALGLTADRQESHTSILGEDYPLSPGADDDGRTRISALRFFQEWTQRRDREVLAARSAFSLGVDWFNATVSDNEPDSRFFAWRGQLQWLRFLGAGRREPLFSPAVLVRSDAQLSASALVPLEQFGLGGGRSVRGYRQDALLADNGILGSVEFWLPVLRLSRQRAVLQVVPFLDAGAVWNKSGREEFDTNTLVGVGVGLQFLQGDRFRARFDWGIPLVDIDSGDKKTWQENGLYFTVEYNLF